MGGGVGGLLYSLRSGWPRFNLSNGRGDVVAQTDETGALTWTASYEAFGKRPVEVGTNIDRQRANTKEEDPTGLLNEGYRYRDLETGTWLSRDPAGFVDGPNLYAYVRQNPWTSFDPDGLYQQMPAALLHAHGIDTTSHEYQEGVKKGMKQGAVAGVLIGTAVVVTVFAPEITLATVATTGGSIVGEAIMPNLPEPPPISQPTETSKKNVHDRSSEYPHDYRPGVRDEIINRYTNERGEIIDPKTGEIIPRDKVTLEHNRPVVDHWNEEGYDQTTKQRADFYNDKSNLSVKPRSVNSREGREMQKMGKTFRQDAGPNYKSTAPQIVRSSKPAKPPAKMKPVRIPARIR